MILVDTNLISEPLRPTADPRVCAWLDRQVPATLFISAVSMGELLLGVQLMPLGKRRSALDASLHGLLLRLFGARILNYDEGAAIAYASIVSKARASGLAIGVPDGQIAAIAYVHGYTVATRDTSPFLAAGLRVINPWEE